MTATVPTLTREQIETTYAFLTSPEYLGLRDKDGKIRAVFDLALSALASRSGGGPLKLDNDRQVFFYEQDHYYLSNFSAFRITFDGQTFDTAEGAYHYQRFSTAEHRRAILYAYSAHEAFRYAQDHKADQRPDWDAVKVGMMRGILVAKVQQHEYVRRKLLQTGDRELIENSWRDDFWGWGHNRDGQNMLGKLWMEIRAGLLAAWKGEG